MTTIRARTHRWMQARGLDTVFGNPGSNELPFLRDLPPGIRYVLGLHEGVVVGMADGYAQATGRPALVNLHSASGTGNAMGALTNAASSHTPLVVTAGQQVRATIGAEPMLANVAAPDLTSPLTKWAGEPLSAQDVPRMLDQALWEACTGSRGPTYVSVPYDDWDQESADNDDYLLPRRVAEGLHPAPEHVQEIAGLLAGARRPALVLGSEVDAVAANEVSRELAELLGADVWVAPSPYRLPFPNRHPQFRGVLPASERGVHAALEENDVVLVLGAPVFRYHQYEPARYLAEGTQLLHVTEDPGEAARAPFGTSFVAGLAATAAALVAALHERRGGARPAAPVGWTVPPPAREPVDGVFHPGAVFEVLRETAPADTAYVVESTSTNGDFWRHMDLREPGSYFWPASGGLGFGLPAAVGVKLARPDRPVIGVVGDGSANYGITALWSAAQYRVPVVFVILNNGTYGALRWFAGMLGTGDVPGLDVPGIDFLSLARGYGVPAQAAGTAAELADLVRQGLAAEGPTLIEVRTELTTP
ncbi:UNVERIFIED_CONTAM: benzoylformate decarboxylase [Kocuria sp. CPCC 205274]